MLANAKREKNGSASFVVCSCFFCFPFTSLTNLISKLEDAEEERRRTQRIAPALVLPPEPPKTFAPSAPTLPFDFGLSDSRSASSLRNVFIAHDLVQKFVKAVVQNTLQNIETCGILAGSLVSNLNERLSYSFLYSVSGFVLLALQGNKPKIQT